MEYGALALDSSATSAATSEPEPVRLRDVSAPELQAPLMLTLHVSDPDVLAELRRHADALDRDRHALAALRVGVLALRAASGQIDASTIREAGRALVGEVREVLSARVTEMNEHGDGLRAQLASTIDDALAAQRAHILREFSLDQKDSALSRLFRELSMDGEGSAMSRISKMLASTSDQIGKNLSLDEEGSAMSRFKRQVDATLDRLARDNVEFQAQVREAITRLDARKKEEARTPRHGIEFEERLGALLAGEAQRLGDLYEATGDHTGAIKNCKVGDHVIELGAESAAAHARIVWEAKEKQGTTLRAALEEIDEARRNRQAQVGVFVFSSKTAPPGLEPLQRHGCDVAVVWDAEDAASDLVVRAAYSLARSLAVRERRADHESQVAIAEIERAARGVEKQAGYLEEVRKWAETVRGHGEKIVERSSRMADDLRREIERLDAQLRAMRTGGAPGE